MADNLALSDKVKPFRNYRRLREEPPVFVREGDADDGSASDEDANLQSADESDVATDDHSEAETDSSKVRL